MYIPYEILVNEDSEAPQTERPFPIPLVVHYN